MDKIFIENLEIFARHGVFPEENALGQKFVICAELECDTRGAGKDDNLAKSVNYAEVCALIKRIMTENTYKLIEAAAEKIAEELLLSYDSVRGVTVTVKKPWAPLLMNIETVGVQITRRRHTAYISLGSNMGDTQSHLSEALNEINADARCSVKRVSDFIVTEPVGDVEQDNFLNACAEVETLLTPHELLDFLHEIEHAHHRERLVHWGPRTLDLDIILYDDLILRSDDLIIPHPEAQNREFVLLPLAQIAPYTVHPVKKACVKELLENLGS